MFIQKHVFAFFILQNIVSSLGGPVQKDVSPESEGSEYVNSDELLVSDCSRDCDDSLKIEKSTAGQEFLTSKNNFYEYEYENLESNTNEHSENNYEEYFKNIFTTEEIDNNFNENSDNDMIEKNEHNFKDYCPGDDHSVISHSDIKYLIEDKAETLKINEKILNSYHPDAEEELNKYMGDLEEFLKRFKERPGHMLHVLHSMVSLREKLEPDVEEIATQIEQFETLEDNFNVVAKGSVVMLKQLEKYKNICKINCEEIDIEPRFGHEIINHPSKVLKSTGMYCISLKDLNDYINEKLNKVQAQYDEGYQPFENRDKQYGIKMSELKSNLKEAAVKQFGMTMYDILSLHDDYHHFKTDLEYVNISSAIYNIMEDTAEISFKRIGLKRDLEKYRQYCMKCNHRVKRNVFEEEEEEDVSVIPIETIKDSENDISFSVNAAVDKLIQAKIDEIKESIDSNLTAMFAELDDKFNDPYVINHYVSDLQPIQEIIENEIKTEQEALHRLRSRIPEASIDKILVLSKEVKQMVQNLESAKQFIDQFV